MNLQYIFTYFRTQKIYIYWLSFQLVIFMGLIGYTLVHYGKNSDEDGLLTTIEAIITVLFFIEMALRLYFSKSKFFLSNWNIVDLTCLIIVLMIYVYSYIISLEQINLEHSEDLTIALLSIRYLCQALRIALELKASNDIREAAKLTFTLDKTGKDLKETELVNNL